MSADKTKDGVPGEVIPLRAGTTSGAPDRGVSSLSMPLVEDDLKGPLVFADRERARIWRKLPDGRTLAVQNLHRTIWTSDYLDGFRCRYLVEVWASGIGSRPYPVNHVEDLPTEIAAEVALLFAEYQRLVAEERLTFAKRWASAEAKQATPSVRTPASTPTPASVANSKESAAEERPAAKPAPARKASSGDHAGLKTAAAAVVLYAPAVVGLHALIAFCHQGNSEWFFLNFGSIVLGTALGWLLRDRQ